MKSKYDMFKLKFEKVTLNMQVFAEEMKRKFVQIYLTDIGYRRDGEGVAIKGEGN